MNGKLVDGSHSSTMYQEETWLAYTTLHVEFATSLRGHIPSTEQEDNTSRYALLGRQLELVHNDDREYRERQITGYTNNVHGRLVGGEEVVVAVHQDLGGLLDLPDGVADEARRDGEGDDVGDLEAEEDVQDEAGDAVVGEEAAVEEDGRDADHARHGRVQEAADQNGLPEERPFAQSVFP